MEGKQYSRAVRLLKVVYEALQQIKLEALEERLLSTHHTNADLLRFLESEELRNLTEEPRLINFNPATELATALFERFQQFEVILSNYGPMAKYWNSFIKMVQILLGMTTSTRTGHWNAHLQASERTLKLYLNYNQTKYSNHFTYYWTNQQKPDSTHPNLSHEFLNGHFTVKNTSGTLNMLSSDQVTEQTINSEQKGAGGITGISTLTGAVQRSIHDWKNENGSPEIR